MDRKLSFIIIIFFLSCYNPIKKAKNFLKENRIEEAESVLLYALKKGNKNPEIHLLLGEIYLEKKFYISALSHFEKVLGKTEFKKNLIKDLRKIYVETRRTGPWIANRSLYLLYLLSPDSLTFEEKKSLAIYFIENEPEESQEFVYKVLNEKFEDELFFKFVLKFYDLGKYRSVIKFYNYFKDKIEESPLYPNIIFYVGSSYYDLGKNYFEKEKIDSSYFYLSKYIAMGSPELYLSRAYFFMGKINLIKGDTTEAISSFRKVLEFMPFKTSGIVQEAREIIRDLKLKGYGG